MFIDLQKIFGIVFIGISIVFFITKWFLDDTDHNNKDEVMAYVNILIGLSLVCNQPSIFLDGYGFFI